MILVMTKKYIRNGPMKQENRDDRPIEKEFDDGHCTVDFRRA
jgi:hypothetical protein